MAVLRGDIVRAANLRGGDRVEIEAQAGDIVIRRGQPPFSLARMFQGSSPAEWQSRYAGAYDWGPDVGRELVDE